MTVSALPRPLARLTPARRRELWAIFKALLYLGPSLFVFVAFIFYPLLQSVSLSLYATDPIGRPSVFVGLEQYQKLLSAPGYFNALAVSVSFVMLTVPAILLVAMCLPAGASVCAGSFCSARYLVHHRGFGATAS